MLVITLYYLLILVHEIKCFQVFKSLQSSSVYGPQYIEQFAIDGQLSLDHTNFFHTTHEDNPWLQAGLPAFQGKIYMQIFVIKYAIRICQSSTHSVKLCFIVISFLSKCQNIFQ